MPVVRDYPNLKRVAPEIVKERREESRARRLGHLLAAAYTEPFVGHVGAEAAEQIYDRVRVSGTSSECVTQRLSEPELQQYGPPTWTGTLRPEVLVYWLRQWPWASLSEICKRMHVTDDLVRCYFRALNTTYAEFREVHGLPSPNQIGAHHREQTAVSYLQHAHGPVIPAGVKAAMIAEASALRGPTPYTTRQLTPDETPNYAPEHPTKAELEAAIAAGEFADDLAERFNRSPEDIRTRCKCHGLFLLPRRRSTRTTVSLPAIQGPATGSGAWRRGKRSYTK